MVIEPTATSLDTFLTDLIQEKHGSPLADDLKEKMLQDLKPRLTQWITLKAMTEIAQASSADITKLQEMVEKKASSESIQEFIQTKIPDFTPFLTRTLIAFRQTYLGA